jgi:hypothetical protein
MNWKIQTPSSKIQIRSKQLWWCIATVAIATLLVVITQTPPRPPTATPEPTVVEVLRTELELRSARLHRVGETNTFNGWMVERYPDGSFRSRSAVTNGLLHGLSQGWHTNGQLQVSEYFKEGVSHGVRTKWSAGGARVSEANILEGRLHGPFRRWHETGALSEHVEFVDNQPDGTSLAYFPSGSLKTRATLQNGQVIGQQSWQDGEFKE